jgi:hypothetical protein
MPFSKIFPSSRSLNLLKKDLESPGKVLEFHLHQSVDTWTWEVERALKRQSWSRPTPRPTLTLFRALPISRVLNDSFEHAKSWKSLKQKIDAWRISLKLNFTVNCYENVIKHIYFTYLLLDKPNRSFMKKSFSYRRDYAWNTLPNEILYIHAWAIYLLSTYSF